MQRVAEAKAKITEITITEFTDTDFTKHTVIDVREPHEHSESKIGDAVNIPRGLIEFEIMKHCETHGADTEMVLYCKTGGRSALAAEALQDLGFSKVMSLAGGIEEWNKHNK